MKNNPDHDTILEISGMFGSDRDTERMKKSLLEASDVGDFALDSFCTVLSTKYYKGEISMKRPLGWL
jgi:hypothetical protein